MIHQNLDVSNDLVFPEGKTINPPKRATGHATEKMIASEKYTI